MTRSEKAKPSRNGRASRQRQVINQRWAAPPRRQQFARARQAKFVVCNQTISQQMRWTRHGADLLLQIRCAVYNGTLGTGFGQLFEPGPSSGLNWAEAA
jgi:hypothetical protein